MNAIPKQPAYLKARELVEGIRGTMTWHAGGDAGGGEWVITLWTRTRQIECRDSSDTVIDRLLYVPNKEDPQTWDDYDDTLLTDAPWRLVDFMREEEKS